MTQTKDTSAEVFAFFNEIGIINQLSNAMLAQSLPDGVHPSHFSILNHLVRTGEGKAPVRIASAMQVTKNTMTHSLKVLEERSFIEVRPDPDDGRGKLVFLTESGRSFRDEAIQKVTQMFSRIIGPEQLELMRRTQEDLVAMRRHLDNNR